MSQKAIIVGILCLTITLVIWMVHDSLCGFSFDIWGARFAAFLQCRP
ncbi:TPA: Hok/Gef family protein [Escherichia coli]|nr:Hok/Gef family protein [Escherichia coli]EFN8406988.1 Hok/Gef family protein [Escherichia coli O15]EEW2344216.1 Hok/Gef family protein [Escherichia coli]EFA7484593.1 Hok/Gef family protein [Escherichia coli]EFN8157038.1 Hok/Gef family protein [Escherichia coli]EGM7138234.1 Hok/Gef family protein [Escherichia coli]